MKRNPTQKRSPLQQTLLWRAGGVILLIALGWLLFAPESGLLSLLRYRAELQELTVETEDLALENERLQEEIDKLQNDIAYFEEVARRDYGLLKPHERVYDFSKPENTKK